MIKALVEHSPSLQGASRPSQEDWILSHCVANFYHVIFHLNRYDTEINLSRNCEYEITAIGQSDQLINFTRHCTVCYDYEGYNRDLLSQLVRTLLSNYDTIRRKGGGGGGG